MGGRGSKQLKIPPAGVGLGGCVKSLIYLLEGGGVRATWKPLWLHPLALTPSLYLFSLTLINSVAHKFIFLRLYLNPVKYMDY